MTHADMTLTLSRAAVARPSATIGFGEWRAQASAAFDAAEPSPERSLCEIVYGDAGLDARRLCLDAEAPQATRFLSAQALTQRELALLAFDALVEGPGAPVALADCRLLVYSAASMDVRFHQSPVGWLAASRELTRQPHFALSQLQGASLAGALDVIDAMLGDEGGAAFVAAEAWPLPFPRASAAPALLGDAGAALWLTRAPVTGLRLAGTWQHCCDPFLLDQADGAPPRMARERLLEAAHEAVREALLEHGLQSDEIDGWLPSGLDPALEECLRLRCAPHAPYAARPRADDGWLCSAAGAALCADVLDELHAGRLRHGALLLSWGASLGGVIGITLWRVHADRSLA